MTAYSTGNTCFCLHVETHVGLSRNSRGHFVISHRRTTTRLSSKCNEESSSGDGWKTGHAVLAVQRRLGSIRELEPERQGKLVPVLHVIIGQLLLYEVYSYGGPVTRVVKGR